MTFTLLQLQLIEDYPALKWRVKCSNCNPHWRSNHVRPYAVRSSSRSHGPRGSAAWTFGGHILYKFVGNLAPSWQSPLRIPITLLQTIPKSFPQTLDNQSSESYNSRHIYHSKGLALTYKPEERPRRLPHT